MGLESKFGISYGIPREDGDNKNRQEFEKMLAQSGTEGANIINEQELKIASQIVQTREGIKSLGDNMKEKFGNVILESASYKTIKEYLSQLKDVKDRNHYIKQLSENDRKKIKVFLKLNNCYDGLIDGTESNLFSSVDQYIKLKPIELYLKDDGISKIIKENPKFRKISLTIGEKELRYRFALYKLLEEKKITFGVNLKTRTDDINNLIENIQSQLTDNPRNFANDTVHTFFKGRDGYNNPDMNLVQEERITYKEALERITNQQDIVGKLFNIISEEFAQDFFKKGFERANNFLQLENKINNFCDNTNFEDKNIQSVIDDFINDCTFEYIKSGTRSDEKIFKHLLTEKINLIKDVKLKNYPNNSKKDFLINHTDEENLKNYIDLNQLEDSNFEIETKGINIYIRLDESLWKKKDSGGVCFNNFILIKGKSNDNFEWTFEHEAIHFVSHIMNSRMNLDLDMINHSRFKNEFAAYIGGNNLTVNEISENLKKFYMNEIEESEKESLIKFIDNLAIVIETIQRNYQRNYQGKNNNRDFARLLYTYTVEELFDMARILAPERDFENIKKMFQYDNKKGRKASGNPFSDKERFVLQGDISSSSSETA